LQSICDEIIVINDGYRLLPSAEHLWATDYHWWAHHIADVTRDFEGRCYTVNVAWPAGKTPEAWGIQAFQCNAGAHGLSRDPKVIHTLRNGGGAAIGLAYHLGFKRLLLLGYDMQTSAGQRHWFGAHPGKLEVQSDYAWFAKSIATIEPKSYGLEIWNCTRQTALQCFPVYDLDQVAARLSSAPDPALPLNLTDCRASPVVCSSVTTAGPNRGSGPRGSEPESARSGWPAIPPGTTSMDGKRCPTGSTPGTGRQKSAPATATATSRASGSVRAMSIHKKERPRGRLAAYGLRIRRGSA
jgi:hypothetical protein